VLSRAFPNLTNPNGGTGLFDYPERSEKASHEVKSAEGASFPSTRHADANERGTAQDGPLRMQKRPSDIPCQLRLFTE
jgi:hypothetical protein